jgi:probable rRNA maturation factor
VTIEVEIDNRSGWKVDEPAVAAAVRCALAAEGVASGDVGVILLGEEEIRQLNEDHRGKPSATDVLSFPMDGREPLPDGVPRQLGDVVVCPAVARAEGTPLETLLVHGALHLVGYDHEADGGAMLARQAELLEEVEPVVADPR